MLSAERHGIVRTYCAGTIGDDNGVTVDYHWWEGGIRTQDLAVANLQILRKIDPGFRIGFPNRIAHHFDRSLAFQQGMEVVLEAKLVHINKSPVPLPSIADDPA